MGIGGHKIQELWKEHTLIDLEWKTRVANYWSRFIHDVKQKDFQVLVNNKNKSLDIIKEDKKIMSLYFTNEMLEEDESFRYSLELVDRTINEELKVGETVRYNGKDWKVEEAKGDWIRIKLGSYSKKINRKVLEKNE